MQKRRASMHSADIDGPFKLLWIVEKFPPSVGGVQKYSYNTVLNMSRQSVVLLCNDNGISGAEVVDKPLLERGQIVYRLPVFPKDDSPLCIVKSFLAFARLCVVILKLAKKYDIDMVLFGTGCFANLYALAFLKIVSRYPMGVLFHGEEIPSIQLRSNGLRRFLVNQADLKICNSDSTNRELSSFMGKRVPAVIAYPGVEERFFHNIDASRFRERLDLKGKRVIYSVGRLDERKGHDTVISIMPGLLKILPNIIYLIAGVGDEYERVKSLTERLHVTEYVRFLGEVSDEEIVDLNRVGDVFVMPNRRLSDGDHEGFGIVFLEANASGKPVIGGRSGGVLDAIVDGQTGFLVDPLDRAELTEKIVFLLKDAEAARRMGLAGQKRAAQYFRWDKLAVQLESQLRRAVRMHNQ